jgi:hypothetical protein
VKSRAQIALQFARGHWDLERTISELLTIEVGGTNSTPTLGVVVSAEDERHVRVRLSTECQMAISASDLMQVLESEESLLIHCLNAFVDPQMVDKAAGSLEFIRLEQSAIDSCEPRLSLGIDGVHSVPLADRVASLLAQHGRAAVVGVSSSGKTVLCDAVRRRARLAGTQTQWIDLSTPGLTWQGILGAILGIRTTTSQAPLVVIDDLQSSPLVAQTLLGLIANLQPKVTLLVAGWPDASTLLNSYIPPAARIRLDGLTTVREMARALDIPWETREELLRVASGDALIARLATDFLSRSSRIPQAHEIAELAFDALVGGHTLTKAQLDALYVVACLASFEIDVDLRYLPVDSRPAVNELLTLGVLRRRPPYIVLGHRSLARLLTSRLRDYDAVDYAKSPAAIAVRYLRSAEPKQIKQTLDRLDLVTLASEDDQFGAAFLAQSWTSLRALTRLLSDEVTADPTWGDNVASAVFAAEAFAALDLADEWAATARYVRTRWPVTSTVQLPRATGETSEADDFVAISERMRAEDEIDLDPHGLSAQDVDLDRFHRTWVLGLLLGFEGSALQPDPTRREMLIQVAQQVQLASGAFYPERVPWVSARVLLGLAAVGETVATSAVATRATDWLRTRRPTGPYSFGVWRPGTGTWNTELQTTAMSLLALGRAGVAPSDPAVRRGISYLRDGRAEWYRSGKEIDCAQSVEAALVLGGSWRDFASEIRGLLGWVEDVNAWSTVRAKASEVQDESSKVSAVASSLIGIIWETVREELPILFEGVAGVTTSSDDNSLNVISSPGQISAVLNRLIAHCESHVRDRESVVATRNVSDEVRGALTEWRLKREGAESLAAQLSSLNISDGAEMHALVKKLNSLGESILGEAWVQVI